VIPLPTSIDHIYVFPVAPLYYGTELLNGVGRVYIGEIFGKEGLWFLEKVSIDEICVCSFSSPPVDDFPNSKLRRLKDHIFQENFCHPYELIDFSDIPWVGLTIPDNC